MIICYLGGVTCAFILGWKLGRRNGIRAIRPWIEHLESIIIADSPQ